MPDLILPVTRYYGSKRKLVEKIWNQIENLNLEFDSVLDLFGGTGTFGFYSKHKGKEVIYNDIFKFNYFMGSKLIEQTSNELTLHDAIDLLHPKPGIIYRSIIQDNFQGIFFTDQENKQIDIFIQNANLLENENKRFSAYYILFQACIIKRPYNLFHRNNLNMRTNYTNGNFGNKVTWERTFEELFERFISELDVITFDNYRNNRAINVNALDCEENADLIYIDPPYFGAARNHTTYHSKYHFLEGLAHYDQLENSINFETRNNQIEINNNRDFEDLRVFTENLRNLLVRYRHSNIILSYRNNGIPSIEEISNLMREVKPDYEVHTIDLGIYGYALNKNNQGNNEYLIVGTNRLID